MFALLRSILIVILGGLGSLVLISNAPEQAKVPIAGLTEQSATTTEKIIIVEMENKNKIEKEEALIPPTQPKAGPPLEEKPKEPQPIKEIVKVESKKPEIVVDQELVDLIVTIPPTQTGANLSTTDINARAREALVNIICTTINSGTLNPITGSGVIIDARGVILTNAHIAQYFLLKDYIVPNYLTCTIRTGSPARNKYTAELLFISSSWVQGNYQKITEDVPKGTGEHDFALLLINGTTNPNAVLPVQFPFVSPDLRELKPEVGNSMVVASYPAGFLGGINIQKDLYAVSTVTQVMEVFTFKQSTLDLFSIGGNIAAQKGSSGGAVVNFDGGLSGIVVTSSEAVQTEDRDLRAITLSHINRSLEAETGTNLNNFLFGNLSAKAGQFQSIVAPGLTALLESALNN